MYILAIILIVIFIVCVSKNDASKSNKPTSHKDDSDDGLEEFMMYNIINKH